MRPRLATVEAVSPYLARMYESGIYSNFGPLTRELEAAYADFLGVSPDQCVTAANATLAIQGSIEVLGDPLWTLPAFTFAATAHAALSAGVAMRFVDVRSDNWSIDLRSVNRTSGEGEGLLSVAPFGAAVDLSIASGLRHVVIDAAASLGASQNLLSGLPSGWAVCFSLHTTKVLPAGEGGLAVFGNTDDADTFRRWTNFSFDDSRIALQRGTNAKMSELHAAYALASLDKWYVERDEWITRLEIARAISERLEIASPVTRFSGARPYWIVEFIGEKEAVATQKHLAVMGIESRRWWPEILPHMPAFRTTGSQEEFPVAKRLSRTTLGLPMHRSLRNDDFAAIESALVGAKI